jgi:hypothetical protein
MGLGLQPNTDMLDGARDDGVGETGEGSGAVVLRVREVGGGECRSGGVVLLELATSVAEGAELDGDAGSDTD